MGIGYINRHIGSVKLLLAGLVWVILSGTALAADVDAAIETGEIPEGFHRMPDGSLMANSPESANVPSGYHLMPDGTLMANTGGRGHHSHGKGGWMFDYKYTRMNMDGMLDGSKELSKDDVFAWPDSGGYMMTPTSMTMDMHMVMAMYGLSDKMMLMGMLHYMSNSMDMVSVNMGSGECESTMESSGLADTVVGVMYQMSTNIMFTGNISLPTGSIDEKGSMDMEMMMGMGCQPVERKLPYGMQLGSGSIDLMPAVSFKDGAGRWGWGIDAEYTYRTGENDNKYTLGNRLELDFLGSFAVTPAVIGSGRLAYSNWEAIDGQDPEILAEMQMMHGGAMMTMGSAPTNDPENYGGSRTDFYIGMDGSFAGGHKVGFELGVPVQQSLNGPQMKTDLLFGLSYQYMM